MKKTSLTLLALLALTALLLSACGAKSAPQSSPPTYAVSSAAPAAAADMAAMEAMQEAGTADTSATPDSGGFSGEMSSAALSDRKIIKHSYLSLETLEFDTGLEQILQMIEQRGGYVQRMSINGQSLGDAQYGGKGYYEKYAEIEARIPNDKLDGTVSELGTLFNVTNRSEQVDDVSDQYFDTEARLKSLDQQEASLLEILSKAEKLEDVVSLQQALSEVRYQIEALTASLRRMDNQVFYSYLNIELREVTIYQPVGTQPKTFGEEVSAAMSRSGENLVRMGKGFVFFLIGTGPVLLVWAVIIGLLVLALIKGIRRAVRRSDARAAAYRESLAAAAATPPAPKPEAQSTDPKK